MPAYKLERAEQLLSVLRGRWRTARSRAATLPACRSPSRRVLVRFASDSPLEGQGFELGREPGTL
jgi:hypothetical protein